MTAEDLAWWGDFLRRKYGILWPIADLEEEDIDDECATSDTH
jgi:hypothetical protein